MDEFLQPISKIMVKLVRKWLHLAMGYFFESIETESIEYGQKLTTFLDPVDQFLVKLVRKWLHLAMGYFFESIETESIGQGQKLTNFYNQLTNFSWNWSENDFILR